MTAKELEHWLIDRGFNFVNDPTVPAWKHPKQFVSVSDNLVQTDQQAVLEFMRMMGID